MLKSSKVSLAKNESHTWQQMDHDFTDNISNMTEFPRSFRTNSILRKISYYKESNGYDNKCTLEVKLCNCTILWQYQNWCRSYVEDFIYPDNVSNLNTNLFYQHRTTYDFGLPMDAWVTSCFTFISPDRVPAGESYGVSIELQPYLLMWNGFLLDKIVDEYAF